METKQIPFDLETIKKIQAGEIKGTILTRDGRPARFLGEIKDPVYPLVFAIETKHSKEKDEAIERLDTYTLTGNYCNVLDERDNDIIVEIENKQRKPESQFKPFDKVLIRDSYDEEWMAGIFSHMTDLPQSFACVGNLFVYQCIPYEGNEHLVGTTDKPKED